MRRALANILALTGALAFVGAAATLTRYGPDRTRLVSQFLAFAAVCAGSLAIAWRLNHGRRSRAAITGHITLFEAPFAEAGLSRTPPVVIRGPRDAIERFIPFAEFDTLFGGFATWAPSRQPTVELPDEALCVWGRRNCQRFRRILRERGATVEVRKEPGPPQRLSKFRRR